MSIVPACTSIDRYASCKTVRNESERVNILLNIFGILRNGISLLFIGGPSPLFPAHTYLISIFRDGKDFFVFGWRVGYHYYDESFDCWLVLHRCLSVYF